LDENSNPVNITYGNINKYITYGSVCSGLDCMDSVCFSTQGISLPSKVSTLAVKRSRGRTVNATSVFDESEFADMASAQTIEEPVESEDGDSGDINSLPTGETVNGKEELSDMLGGVSVDAFESEDIPVEDEEEVNEDGEELDE